MDFFMGKFDIGSLSPNWHTWVLFLHTCRRPTKLSISGRDHSWLDEGFSIMKYLFCAAWYVATLIVKCTMGRIARLFSSRTSLGEEFDRADQTVHAGSTKTNCGCCFFICLQALACPFALLRSKPVSYTHLTLPTIYSV